MVRQRSLVTSVLFLIFGCILPLDAQEQESGKASTASSKSPVQGVKRAQSPKQPEIDEKPYRIRTWLAVAPEAALDAQGRAAWLEEWSQLLSRFVGQPWQVELAEGAGPLLAGTLEELQPQAVEPLAKGFDKAWLIVVDRLEQTDGYRLSAREYDSATGLLSLVFSRSVRSYVDAPRALLDLSLDMFSPTAEIQGQSEGGVSIRVRGASLPASNPVGRVVKPGSVFRASRVIYNPDGSVRQISSIPRTYLRVESISSGIARCQIISRLRDPLTRLIRGKYKVVAVGLKPSALPTRLRFQTSPPDNRPAAGYTIAVRSAPKGPSRIIGTTDREGRIVLEPHFVEGLAMVRLLAAGVEPLDDFPIMPGEQAEERLVIIDPKSDAVALESQVVAIRDVVVDEAAKRARLEALIKPRAESENWDEVRLLLDEYKKYPKKTAFQENLESLRTAAQTKQNELRRPVLTRTALQLLSETSSLVERYIDDDAFASFEDAYDRYAATAPPDKVKARTLPGESPEEGLSRLTVTSAANAGLEEVQAGLAEYTPAGQGFRLAVPAGTTPHEEKRDVVLPSGAKSPQKVFIVDDEKLGRFSLAYVEFEKPLTRESQISKLLDGMRQVFLSEGRRSKIINERPILVSGYPGREIEVEIPPTKEGELKTFSRNRAILVGNRLYTISVLGNEAMVRARRAELFLDSFRPQSDASAEHLASRSGLDRTFCISRIR